MSWEWMSLSNWLEWIQWESPYESIEGVPYENDLNESENEYPYQNDENRLEMNELKWIEWNEVKWVKWWIWLEPYGSELEQPYGNFPMSW